MDILRRVSHIYVTSPSENSTITTIQYFNEDEDRVILQCAENVSIFKRGFVCDMEVIFSLVDASGNKIGERSEMVEDLVLVYINKKAGYDYVPEFEYVFYK